MEPTVVNLATARERYFMIVGGRQTDALSNERIDVVCPSDGRVFASIPRGQARDVDRAVAAAREALDNSAWTRMPAVDRGRILMRLAALIVDNEEALAALEAKDTGKPIRHARADIATAARYMEFYGSAADKFGGETIPVDGSFTAMVVREPYGVVGSILPWNSPTQILGRSAGPALAMGNVMVVKPAEDACLSVIRFAELALEAGLPSGVLNVVTGYGVEAGAALAAHPGVDFVAFIGSTEIGPTVQKAAADHYAKVTLELGGKSPQIVFEDADLDEAIPAIVTALTLNSGQSCSAGSRVLIEASAWDRVVERLTDRFANLVAGPHDHESDFGPLINRKQQSRVQRMIERARNEGVPLLAEGRLHAAASASGFYVPSSLLGPVPSTNSLARNEVLGPVLSVLPFATEDEAVRLANDTDFGLVTGIWTRDGSRAMRIARRVRSGQVFLNSYSVGGGVELPFGGSRRSGYGREKGLEALREYSLSKTIVVRHG
jgi:aldehyde dehydrogenase (NAD+)